MNMMGPVTEKHPSSPRQLPLSAALYCSLILSALLGVTLLCLPGTSSFASHQVVDDNYSQLPEFNWLTQPATEPNAVRNGASVDDSPTPDADVAPPIALAFLAPASLKSTTLNAVISPTANANYQRGNPIRAPPISS